MSDVPHDSSEPPDLDPFPYAVQPLDSRDQVRQQSLPSSDTQLSSRSGSPAEHASQDFLSVGGGSLRALRHDAGQVQARYRDFGIELYDLPADDYARLVADTANNIERSFIVTAERPEPQLATLLRIVMDWLDHIPSLMEAGEINTAGFLMRQTERYIGQINVVLLEIGRIILRVQLRMTPSTDTEVQRAQRGEVPETFLLWCRCLRGVRRAIELGTIEDDPHAILESTIARQEGLLEYFSPEFSAEALNGQYAYILDGCMEVLDY